RRPPRAPPPPPPAPPVHRPRRTRTHGPPRPAPTAPPRARSGPAPARRLASPRSPDLQRAEGEEREQDPEDPEADDHLALRPARPAPPLRRRPHRRSIARLGRQHAVPRGQRQQRRRAPAPGQPQHADSPRLAHRIFSVLKARSANRIPRIQKRMITLLSAQPA